MLNCEVVLLDTQSQTAREITTLQTMMNAKLSQHCNKDKFSKLYKMIKLLPDGYNLFPSNKGNI